MPDAPLPKWGLIALARPCFDPDTYDMRPNMWSPTKGINAGLTVNIGME